MEDTKSVKSLGIYCRVSSKKQMDNTSLENQREREEQKNKTREIQTEHDRIEFKSKSLIEEN